MTSSEKETPTDRNRRKDETMMNNTFLEVEEVLDTRQLIIQDMFWVGKSFARKKYWKFFLKTAKCIENVNDGYIFPLQFRKKKTVNDIVKGVKIL